jgi:hypothetical protein
MRGKIDPTNSNRLYIVKTTGGQTGLWLYDAGLPVASRWTKIDTGTIAFITDVAIDPLDATRIVISTSQAPFRSPTLESGIWMKEGTGAWRQQNAGLRHLDIPVINFHPNGGVIVAGSGCGGAYRSNVGP